MDAFGFALATAVLATAFTVFGIIDRVLVGLTGELRYTIAPAISDGVRAWAAASDGRVRAASLAAEEPMSRGSDGDRHTAGRRSPGLRVPIRPVSRRP